VKWPEAKSPGASIELFLPYFGTLTGKLQTLGYLGVLAACFVIGMLAAWNPLAARIDHQAYDWMSEAQPTPARDAVVVGIDEAALRARGEMQNIRKILVEALDKIAEAKPKAVAVDVILASEVDPVDDARLEAALRATPNLTLPAEIDTAGKWEEPAPRFQPLAKAIGHVHFVVDKSDGVSRDVALQQAVGTRGHWALALEAFRLAQLADIEEHPPEDVQIGKTVVPALRSRDSNWPMRIRFLAPGAIPTVPLLDLDKRREQLRGKVVFLGITALSAAHDRLVNPMGESVSGVEVHAQIYETLRAGRFLTDAKDSTILAVAAGFTIATGLIFYFLSGWPAYAAAAPLLAFSFYVPVLFFRQDQVFPMVAPVAVAWLSAIAAATYQHFVVRRTLRRTESEKSRYQQAIHWAAHEMRTPLTAIQGSSELMSRYKLPEEKRGQLSEMINSESKRLARIIQTFLDVERLAEGQMDLKRETFPAAAIVDVCVARAAPLADRKSIAMSLDTTVEGTLRGDRELMEYAFYNLLTNAVKYSPPDTQIRISAALRGSELRLAVTDEGMGMDAKELKNIFQKFYRTKRAEASGEVGTGIGLSIVEQIVTHHGGRMEVASTPGKGSCFTMILLAVSPSEGGV